MAAGTIHELAAQITSNVRDFVRGMKQGAAATKELRQEWRAAAQAVAQAGARVATAAAGAATATAAATQRMVSGIRAAAAATKDLRDKWGTAARDVLRSADRMAMAVGAVATAAATMAAKVGLSFNAMKRSAEVGFATMLGGARQAQQLMAELTRFAVRTPFQLSGLIQDAQKMLAMGFDVREILPTLRSVGDAVAGLGGSPERLNRIIVALGQIRAKGRVMAQEMLQLTENGIAAWQMLADKMGMTIPEVMQQVEAGAVSADFAIAALTEGMDRRFGGLMAKMSREVSGQWANLKDQLEITLGRMTEPLFQAIGRWLTRLNQWMGTGQFRQFVADARAAVEQLTVALERSWPQIRQAAQQLWEFIQPILRFLAEHPRLVAALAILKGAQMMGVTQAVASTAQALISLASEATSVAGKLPSLAAGLGRVATAAKGATTNLTATLASVGRLGLIGAGIAVATMAVLGLADAFGVLGQRAESAADQAARAARIAEAGRRGVSQARTARLEEAEGSGRGDALFRLRQLEAQAAREATQAGRQVLDLEAKVNSEEQRRGTLDRLRGSLAAALPFGDGNFETRAHEENKKLLEERRRQADEAESFLELVRQRRRMLERQLQGQQRIAQDTGAEADAQAGVVTLTKEKEKQLKEQEKERQRIADAFEAARQAALARETRGFADIRELLRLEGATGADITQFASSLQGMTPELARHLGTRFDELGGAAGDQEQLDQLATQIAQAVNEERRRDEAAKLATQEGQRFAGTVNNLALPSDQLEQFWNQAEALADAMVRGSLSAEQFRAAMERVTQSAIQASKATNELAVDHLKEAQIKAQEDALIKGDFAGAGLGPQQFAADVQFFLRKRLLEMREQQYQNAIEQAINGLLGFHGAVEGAANGLGQFGRRLEDGFGQGAAADPARVSQAMDTLNTFMNSIAGQIALTQNELALAQQRLVYLSGLERQRTLEFIDSLKQRLEQLLNTPPLFSGISDDGFFRDPGAAGAQQGGGGAFVTISLPNVTRISNTEAAMLADAVAGAQSQQGRPF